MPHTSPFPLTVLPDKINSPALQAFFQQFGTETYLSAEEINEIINALNYLSGVASGVISTTTDQFISAPGFDVSGNNVTAMINWKWILDGFIFTNTASVPFTIPYCATGKTRIDRLVANGAHTFVRVPGPEVTVGVGTPAAAAVPIGTLPATIITVTDSSISTPTLPSVNAFRGTFSTVAELEASVVDPFYGHFAFVFSASVNMIAQHNGNIWKYTSFFVPFRKFVLWETGNTRSITVDAGVSVRRITINEIEIYPEMSQYTQASPGANVVINSSVLFDDQSRILITN